MYIITLLYWYWYMILIYSYVHVWSCCKLVRQLQQEDEVSEMEKRSFGRLGEEWKESQFRFTCCRSSSTEGQLSILYSLCMSFVYLNVRIPEHGTQTWSCKVQHEETNLFFVMGVSFGQRYLEIYVWFMEQIPSQFSTLRIPGVSCARLCLKQQHVCSM